ncbi:MAG: hypothetical protein J0H68_08465 [Sphingobacteriia bacterium]|nr:hypothetical protein [Sphingobacteriia bacterium]
MSKNKIMINDTELNTSIPDILKNKSNQIVYIEASATKNNNQIVNYHSYEVFVREKNEIVPVYLSDETHKQYTQFSKQNSMKIEAPNGGQVIFNKEGVVQTIHKTAITPPKRIDPKNKPLPKLDSVKLADDSKTNDSKINVLDTTLEIARDAGEIATLTIEAHKEAKTNQHFASAKEASKEFNTYAHALHKITEFQVKNVTTPKILTDKTFNEWKSKLDQTTSTVLENNGFFKRAETILKSNAISIEDKSSKLKAEVINTAHSLNTERDKAAGKVLENVAKGVGKDIAKGSKSLLNAVEKIVGKIVNAFKKLGKHDKKAGQDLDTLGTKAIELGNETKEKDSSTKLKKHGKEAKEISKKSSKMTTSQKFEHATTTAYHYASQVTVKPRGR